MVVFGFAVAYVALCFGLRSHLHRRRTGDSGVRPSRAPAAVLFSLALVTLLAAPLLPLPPLWSPSIAQTLAGGLCAFLGTAGTWWAQDRMGSAWRIGVGQAERTELVTAGVFSHVRNPIFSFVLATALGGVLVLPTVAMFGGFLLLVLAVELQVRLVEEPHLLRLHGSAYADYCRRVGRFVPRLGVVRDGRE
jgi:protein-S-isoprenylcysteine O-methyltransferase Ste14